jgi:hypothetical protein
VDGGTLFADDFTRPDGPSLGPNWTILSGSWAIQSYQLALTAAAAGAQIARPAAPIPQVNYQVRAQVVPLSGMGYAGIVARLANASSYYMLRLRVDQGTVALLRGPTNFLGSPYPVPGGLTFGATYALRLTVQGSQITGEFSPDGGATWVPVASVSDAAYAGPGFAGVLGGNSSTARWIICGAGAAFVAGHPSAGVVPRHFQPDVFREL